MMVCVSVGRPESDCHVTVTKLSSGSDNDEIDHHGAPVSLRTSAVLQYFINYEDVFKEGNEEPNNWRLIFEILHHYT